MADNPIPRDKASQGPGAWLRDERVLQALAQLVFAGLVIGLALLLYRNMANALGRQGMKLGYDFLRLTSGFDISIAWINHTRESSNLNAIEVAMLNTITVSILAILISTVLGTLVGIARISSNYLVNRLAWLYIEVFRNIPLLLVIIASYTIYIFNLPMVGNAIVLPGPAYLSNRGLNLPSPVPGASFPVYLGMLAIGLIAGIAVAQMSARRYHLDGFQATLIALGIWLLTGIIAARLMPAAPFTWDFPVKKGLNYTGGYALPPEFMGALIGLVMGSAPFTADMVRAGIESVSKGQLEAAHALGLSGYQTLRLVILPQAMRVIVPPMTSNYLSLIKNSSLAAVIAYPEILHVSSTITSQTGRAVEMMSLMMLIYLTFSLITSAFMNWYNSRVKIVER